MAGLGPDKLPLMYYNLMDAYAAGIRRVVLILREELTGVVERDFLPHIPRDIQVDIAIQRVEDLPQGCPPRSRQKPWGTGHALWCAREKLPGPFITVNGDDYYGPSALGTLARHFQCSLDWGLVCYTLDSTLSPHGGVNRGLCALQDDYLMGIEECSNIHWEKNALRGQVGKNWRELKADTPISMNLWGFTPLLFEFLEQGLIEFLHHNCEDPKAEYLLPDEVLASIEAGRVKVRGYRSNDQWLGITYPEDLALVNAALATRSGV